MRNNLVRPVEKKKLPQFGSYCIRGGKIPKDKNLFYLFLDIREYIPVKGWKKCATKNNIVACWKHPTSKYIVWMEKYPSSVLRKYFKKETATIPPFVYAVKTNFQRSGHTLMRREWAEEDVIYTQKAIEFMLMFKEGRMTQFMEDLHKRYPKLTFDNVPKKFKSWIE